MKNSLENVCRACLSSELKEMHSFAEFSEFDDNLGSILHKCCDIETKMNGAANIICTVCRIQVLAFYKFKKQCQQNDSILRNYFELKSKVAERKIETLSLEASTAEALQLKISNLVATPQIQNAKSVESKTSEFVPECKIEKDLEFEELYIKEEVNDDDLTDESTIVETSNKAVQLSMMEVEINKNNDINISNDFTNEIVKSNITTNDVNINETMKINDYNKDVNCNKCNLTKCKCNKSRTTYKKRPKKMHKCSICNEEFLTTASLTRHVAIHECALPFICDVCGKCFAKYDRLQVHQIHHTGEKPHVCTFCGWKFALSSNLIAHKRIHTGVKPFKCKECDKTFAQWSSLRSHSISHTDIKSFICQICGKSYRRRAVYTNHMASHSDERKFECDICKKRFNSATQRSKHRITHSDDKKHICKVCSKGFHRAVNLKIHEMTHSGERPHVCVLCGKGFIQAHCLRTHMNTHC